MNRKLIHIIFALYFLPFAFCFAAMGQGTSQFPTNVDTGQELPTHADNTQTFLTQALTSSETGNFTVSATSGFPAYAVIQIGNELIFVNKINGTTFDVHTRGIGGTVAADHPLKATVRAVMTSAHVNGLQGAVLALETKLGSGSSTPGANKMLWSWSSSNTGWATLTAGSNITITPNSGAGTVTVATTGVPTGTGSAGQVTYWSGASTQTGSNNLFWDSGNNRLGIKTASPSATFHVYQTNTDAGSFPFLLGDGTYGFKFGKTASSPGYDPTIVGYPKGSPNPFSIMSRIESGDDLGTEAALAFVAQTTGAVAIGTRPVFGVYNGVTKVFHVEANGKVGISLGSTTAAEKLHILGDANSGGTMAAVRIDDSRVTTNARNWMIANFAASCDFGDLIITRGNSQGAAPSATYIAQAFDKDGKISIGAGFCASSRLHLKTQSSSEIGLIVQGAASQSANLFEVRDSSNAVIASIDSTGSFGQLAAAQVNVTTSAANKKGIVVKGFSGQTANLQEWQNNSATVLASVSAAGDVFGASFTLGSSVTWTKGSGAPAGACTTGSFYSRTDGGAGSTYYVCEAGAWVSK